MGVAVLDQREEEFIVRASLTDLEEVTGLSRPMVVRGVEAAAEFGFFTVKRGGPVSASRFTLSCPQAEAGQAGGWAKLPRPEVIQRVPQIPHRGAGGLIALKIYLTLIAARPNNSLVSQLRHVTLRSKTGAQTRDLRRAISILGNEGLVDVNYEDPEVRWGTVGKEGRQAQRYILRGNLHAPGARTS